MVGRSLWGILVSGGEAKNGLPRPYFRVFVLNYCFGSVACRFIEKTWVEVVDLFEVMDL